MDSYKNSYIGTIPSKKKGPRRKLWVLSNWLTLVRLIIISNINTNVNYSFRTESNNNFFDKENRTEAYNNLFGKENRIEANNNLCNYAMNSPVCRLF